MFICMKQREKYILFMKVAKVPSVIDSPMKGTIASTKSPGAFSFPPIHILCFQTSHRRMEIVSNAAKAGKISICKCVPFSEANDLLHI